ncbi:TraR/DksA family transcriptional regulator [Mesorhizobium xinjiangense]|uniref:TraR/DksA family transcriptional regulator n=1 Tax=Mesorhizobium xinjiangense TaxID=2678685 RepID=UPI0012EE494C|nr:TraR/DksA C4-type zinc finger protein [Mesorhizobium xinjiangense]
MAEPDQAELKTTLGALLEAELAELDAQSRDTEDHRAPVELDQQSVGRVSRIDALQVQAMAQAVEQRRKSRIARIRAALRRMGEGEFGYCAECGEFIGIRRLETDPTALTCVACASGRSS